MPYQQEDRFDWAGWYARCNHTHQRGLVTNSVEPQQETIRQKIGGVVFFFAMLGLVGGLMFAVYGHDVFWWPF